MATSFRNKNEGGISPIIRIILVVAITVALTSLATIVIFNLNMNVSETPKSTVTLDDNDIRLIRIGNADKVIVREGGIPDYELSVGEKYEVSGEYEYDVIGVINGKETLIHSGDGKKNIVKK